MKSARELAQELIESTPYDVIDNVYRLIKKNYVKEDAVNEIHAAYEDRVDIMSEDEIDDLADCVAEEYVFEGRYDCNCTYWENIDDLIEDELNKKEAVV